MARDHHLEERRQLQSEADRQCVLNELECGRTDTSTPLPPSDLEQMIKDYAAARERRVGRFLEHVKMKHRTFLERACPVEC